VIARDHNNKKGNPKILFPKKSSYSKNKTSLSLSGLIAISLRHSILLQLFLKLSRHLTNLLQMLEAELSIPILLHGTIPCRSQGPRHHITNLSPIESILMTVLVDHVIDLLSVFDQVWLEPRTSGV
jgi:hypothetical protein